MTALLVLLTFSAFIAVDLLLGFRRAGRQEKVQPIRSVSEPTWVPEPVWVAGFRLPETLHYHRGHTWARVEDGDTVVVGLDDFAGKLIGDPQGIQIPDRGTWLRQGEKGFRVEASGRRADLVAPVEGEVTEINPQVLREPELAVNDPYGRGWILKVRVRNLAANLRNLLSGSLARKWMQDAREGLEIRLMALSGSVLQDGGEPVADFARHLSSEDWERIAGEFLLT